MEAGFGIRRVGDATFDRDVAAGISEFHGIREQIDEDLPHAVFVALECGGSVSEALSGQSDALFLGACLHERQRCIRGIPGTGDGGGDGESSRLELCEIEHLVDETEQVAATRPDPCQLLPLLRGHVARDTEVE